MSEPSPIDRLANRWWAVPVLALVVTAVVMLSIVRPLVNDRQQECEDKGGHIGARNLCLAPDGRVIE